MRRKLVLLAALLTSVGTMARPVEARSFPGLGEEQVPRYEAAAIERSKGIFQKFMLETYGDQPAGDAKRGVHPVAHGCVRGVLKVRAGVPAWAKKGLFEEPSEYKAWIRFSNASSRPQADREADSRGFAMKVLGVGGDRILEKDQGGHTLDFTMNSFPVFFSKDAWDYTDFINSFLLKGGFTSYIFPSFDPTSWRLKEANILRGIGNVKVSSPLNAEYFSIVPFRHGRGTKVAVKYSVKPCGGVRKVPIDMSDDRYLKKAMIRALAREAACFHFGVQRQMDPVKMPIEDATALWNEKVSPFIPVATIVIPRQSFDSPRRNEFCENLTFNPWRSLPDHRPLGGVNRLRLSNYIQSDQIRKELNRAVQAEPAADWSF